MSASNPLVKLDTSSPIFWLEAALEDGLLADVLDRQWDRVPTIAKRSIVSGALMLGERADKAWQRFCGDAS